MTTTRQVQMLTGASYRQLDHWVRRGYVGDPDAPHGSGIRRCWTPDEVRRADVLMRLSQLGVLTPGRAYHQLDEALLRISTNPGRGWLILTQTDVMFVQDIPMVQTAVFVQVPALSTVAQTLACLVPLGQIVGEQGPEVSVG